MDCRVCVKDYEETARLILGRNEREYLESGADEEFTARWNQQAFQGLVLRQKVLRNVSSISLKTTFLGRPVEAPIGVAPTGYQGCYYPEGELATTRGAFKAGCCHIMSSYATSTPEQVAAECPDGLKWFQVYISKNRDDTSRAVRRSAAAGFRALVLTVDLPVVGKRRCNARRPFILQPHVVTPLFSGEYDESGLPGGGDVAADVTWKDIAWLKSLSGLPVIAKGVLCGEDAELAIKHGADAIIVSNHGGRQLDTVPATIHVLSEVVTAVGCRLEVYLDGGVRTGSDVLKALALGARGVFVGRPVVWGLVSKGSEGVREVLGILKAELTNAMAYTGCKKISEIRQELVSSRYKSAHL